jgi:glycosyltransferase involved in cell wall biosynthesis
MISIVVPIYKVEKYLKRCIDSILSQTYKDIEIILVDDGSPDNCGNICDDYAKADKRIVVIHKSNGGLSDARNAGLDIAKGEYIGFVDSDDYIDSCMYETLYLNAINNSADISMCGYYDVIEETGKKYTQCKEEAVYVWNRKETLKEILQGKRLGVHAPTKLYKKRLFDGVRYPVGKVSEDTFIITDLFNKVQKAVFIESPLYYYYHRKNSINTSEINERDLTRFDAFEKNCDYIRNHYPDLLSLANDNYIKEKFLVGRKILLSKNGKEYNNLLKEICKFLRKNIINIFNSSYFDRRKKLLVVCFAICPRLYKAVLIKKYDIK